ncbi:MAG: tRNA N6-adenosine threonylcarbamoyltransferase [Patescibacteria group bacterium]|nr:MAG: tRNA N6-adenosine threonylcarbamoyltransferase [Patescibacteria group bacterium]
MILSIDTSCDETAAAIVEGRKVLANVIYSQVLIHQKWGGVVPSIAKRAHEERIDWVIDKLKIDNVDYIAVTQGPGLAPALEVGIKKAKELAKKYNKKLIAVNHLEGHIYSPFVQNSKGNPKIDFQFPYLVLTVSGGHTSLVIFKDHLQYQVIGETIDDAAGEALDKAAKLLGLGYPGGPVIERLAAEVDNIDRYQFPRPMAKSNDLNFSFSGLKTSFFYYLKKLNDRDKILNIKYLASSFQQAVFDSLLIKTEKAILKTGIKNLSLVGGVSANMYLRKLFRQLAKKYQGKVVFPSYKYLTGDNAAMIGVVASYKAKKNLFTDIENLDRSPRMRL